MNKNNVNYHQMERKLAGEAKQRILDFASLFLAFTSLFPFHLMIIYIIFVHTPLYVMVLQVGKICVLNLPFTSSQQYVNYYMCQTDKVKNPSLNPGVSGTTLAYPQLSIANIFGPLHLVKSCCYAKAVLS